MEFVLMGAGIFLVTVLVVELLSYAYRNTRSAQSSKIQKRLRKYSYLEGGKDGTEIMKIRVLSDIPFFNRLLNRLPGINRLDKLIIQANAKQSIGYYILLALMLAGIGFLAGSFVLKNPSLSLLFSVIGLLLPFFYLVRMQRKRIERFKKQLPDGLDLMARALKAGHALTGSMNLAAEQFEDPLGPELSETLDEINFGISVQEALKNLVGRIDCEELKYFVVGVILQRETGGNLAELIETLAHLIRERFKFQGKVRVLAAEGKLSAIILIALPFVVAGFIMISNPKYLTPLTSEPMGRVVILLAMVAMAIGVMVMRKMIKIEV